MAVASVYTCSVLWPAWPRWPAIAAICRAGRVAHPNVTEDEDYWKDYPSIPEYFHPCCASRIFSLYSAVFMKLNGKKKKNPKGRCFSAWKIFEAGISPALSFLRFAWLTLRMGTSLPRVQFSAGTCARFWYLNSWIIDSRTFWTGFLILLTWFIIFGLLTLIGVKFNYKKLKLIISP